MKPWNASNSSVVVGRPRLLGNLTNFFTNFYEFFNFGKFVKIPEFFFAEVTNSRSMLKVTDVSNMHHVAWENQISFTLTSGKNWWTSRPASSCVWWLRRFGIMVMLYWMSLHIGIAIGSQRLPPLATPTGHRCPSSSSSSWWSASWKVGSLTPGRPGNDLWAAAAADGDPSTVRRAVTVTISRTPTTQLARHIMHVRHSIPRQALSYRLINITVYATWRIATIDYSFTANTMHSTLDGASGN